VGALSTSQFISLFIFALALFLLIRSRKAVNDFEVADAGEQEPVAAAEPEIAEEIVETAEVAGSAAEISGENAGDGSDASGDDGDQ
jgi:hypothetical protein